MKSQLKLSVIIFSGAIGLSCALTARAKPVEAEVRPLVSELCGEGLSKPKSTTNLLIMIDDSSSEPIVKFEVEKNGSYNDLLADNKFDIVKAQGGIEVQSKSCSFSLVKVDQTLRRVKVLKGCGKIKKTLEGQWSVFRGAL